LIFAAVETWNVIYDEIYFHMLICLT
jgi:hypothetical protein